VQVPPIAHAPDGATLRTMALHLLHTTRELASRTSDGIHVQLLWCERDGGLAVAVADGKTGEAFAVDVRDGERAMDVFHHPYAYAAWHGIATDGAAQDAAPQSRPLAA
jgi:hypothetical protein